VVDDGFLQPIRKADIEVGKPLPFAVYDADRNLLLNRGVTVYSEHQLGVLLEKGLFRERARTAANPTRTDTLPTEPGTGAGQGRPTEETLDLDALKLLPGDALQLQPLQDGVTERWTVRVIGQMRPKSLLVSAPMVDGKLIFIKDGQGFLARAFSGLNVCAFKAKVLKSQLQPFPYLHLAWPESVQAMRIRKAMRAPIHIIVAILDGPDGRQVAAGKFTDISVGGGKLLAMTKLGHKEQKLWLSFKINVGDMEEYVKTSAVIRTTGEEADEHGTVMKAYGVQFGELGQSQRLIIMNLVYQFVLKEPA